ncbi:MAG: type II toxin-antitoxin system HicB family antitoxin [Gammaproteobacteria bacterium]|nr:type II toxin-antitoxin system HicB family antitoxin [Gammaproteobacteria bacterium]
MLSYKGFLAQIEYEPKTDTLIGEVINAEDVLIFEGSSVKQLKQRFAAVIDDYLTMRSEEGLSNPRPLIGRFTVTLALEDQQKVVNAAAREDVGVQIWLNREIQELLSRFPDSRDCA